jgi:putative oxidoreductase
MLVFRKLIDTRGDQVTVLLRWMLALVILPHGLQKAFGWFGGYGFSGTMGFLTGAAGLPTILALLVIAAELLGPIGLALGFLSRIAAFGIGAVMVGAVLTVHLHNGFFMNWGGGMAGEGYEYHLLVLALVAAILVRGSGPLSLDRLLSRKLAR